MIEATEGHSFHEEMNISRVFALFSRVRCIWTFKYIYISDNIGLKTRWLNWTLGVTNSHFN